MHILRLVYIEETNLISKYFLYRMSSWSSYGEFLAISYHFQKATPKKSYLQSGILLKARQPFRHVDSLRYLHRLQAETRHAGVVMSVRFFLLVGCFRSTLGGMSRCVEYNSSPPLHEGHEIEQKPSTLRPLVYEPRKASAPFARTA